MRLIKAICEQNGRQPLNFTNELVARIERKRSIQELESKSPKIINT